MARDKSKAPNQIVVFAGDAETESVASASLAELAIESGAVKRGGVDVAIEYLSTFASPRLVVVDISNSQLPLSAVNSLAEACEPGVEVIVIGKHNDIGLFRDLMQLGVSDYLVKPLTRELFRRSIERVRGRSQVPNTRGRTGKVIAITGARGGVGATTVAANLGWLLDHKIGRRVAMVDLDFNHGALSLALDQKAAPGLREALENIHRVDQLFLERTLVHVDSRMALLSCEEPLEYEVKFETCAYDELIGHLVKQFHYVVVDVPRGSGPNFQHALRNATIRVIVIDPTVAAVRHAIRLLKIVGAEDIGRQTIVVLNRRWAQGDGDLAIKDIEKALNRRVDVTVPYGKNVLVVAENSGELVASRKSPVTEALSDLVQELSGRPPVKSSPLARFMRSATRSFQGNSGRAGAAAPDAATPIEVGVHNEPGGTDELAPPRRANGRRSFSDTLGDRHQPNKLEP
jgi:pilus assembly protein CpaE